MILSECTISNQFTTRMASHTAWRSGTVERYLITRTRPWDQRSKVPVVSSLRWVSAMREFQYTASGRHEENWTIFHTFANTSTRRFVKMSPLLNIPPCRPSRLPSSLSLHVINWCMSAVGRCSNSHLHPSASSVNGFTAESSFEHRAASTCLYQNTIRKNIRYNPQVWSLSGCFVSRRL
jgi:hypothetical protein